VIQKDCPGATRACPERSRWRPTESGIQIVGVCVSGRQEPFRDIRVMRGFPKLLCNSRPNLAQYISERQN